MLLSHFRAFSKRFLNLAKMATVPNNSAATTPAGPTAFHGVISLEDPTYKPEANRYVLYLSYACPWASRTLVARKLKKLDDFVQLVIVDPEFSRPEQNAHIGTWQFNSKYGVDPVLNAKLLREIYFTHHADYAGRITVPVLFDKKTKTIVNNESAEIIRIFNSGFNSLLPNGGKGSIDLYPVALRDEIEALNQWIYSDLNRGVYKAGFYPMFVKTQEEHETNCKAVFAALDKIEELLGKRRFIAGDVLTDTDVRVFTTIVRFPTVYELHFKCNLKTFRFDHDYPRISKWSRLIYQLPGIAETVNQDHIKRHYYKSQVTTNPSGLVPLYNGPDLSQPKVEAKESDFARF